ncbi:hypothetical protein [Streptomyces sp. SPB162]|uniref:hypothetical protein n=1 Tax=Streptomyces sp. SPB162 TaxID=2940560 RepID=UPI0024065787|nr:hypothetical protein [Streptomyces sp. SPB162]MDF9817081.1 hypothetical protein [Streptomyces sp. SPB162]
MDTDRFAWSELDRTVQRRLQELPGLPESPQFKKKGRRSPKAEPRSAGLDALITDLHSAARPGAHQPPELRRNVEDRLRFLPDTDLVEILRRPLSIEAQHLVLVMLPEPARPHDEGVKLCNALLSARLLLTSIAVPTRNETVRSLHIERAVTVACWLFHWLVQPLALDCDEALKKFLNDVASSQAAVDRHLVSELFIDSPLPRTPHLSDHVWQTLARGLSQREAAWVDEGRRHDPRLR